MSRLTFCASHESPAGAERSVLEARAHMNTYKSFLLVITIAAVLFATAARADDDEATLVGRIESVLREIKDQLDGVSSQSSSSRIDRAMDHAKQIEDLADKLRSANAQSDKGKTMGNYYRDYARKFGDSAKYLRQMKDQQLRQANDRLAEKCRDSQQRLRDEINRFVEKNDPAGITKIPELAERVARDYQDPFKRDTETHRYMADWKDYAKNFSESDGGWNDVRSKLQSEADRIWDAWRSRYEETAKSENCGDIIRAKENPVAVRALGQLVGNDDIRKGLIKELDVQIKKVYESIKDVDRRSDDGASQIQDAQEAVREIMRILDKLRGASGEDDTAKRIADNWPDKLKSLQESLSALKKLKAGQRLIDRGVEACGQAETGLRELIKDEIANRDDRLEGWTRIDEKARALGETFKDKLQRAQEQGRDMESWKNDAVRWNAPDGRGWSDVKSALNAAAEGTSGYYKTTYEKVDIACKQLSWGTQHPEVKRAAVELKEHASSRDSDYVKLRDRAKKFASDVRSYRTLLAEDDAKIHELVCVNGSSRGDEGMEEAIAEIADRWASQLISSWHIIEPEAEQIKRDADVLIARKVPNARKIKRSIEDLMVSINKSIDGLNKGANDPLIKKAIECGISKHKSMGSCTLRDVPVSGRYCTNPNPTRKRSDCAIDCINGCDVIEFKPDNKEAREAGRKQSYAYWEGLKKWYATEGDKMFDGQLSSLRSCVKGEGDKKYLDVTNGEVQTYNFCECFPDLTEGVSRQQPSIEIPDRER